MLACVHELRVGKLRSGLSKVETLAVFEAEPPLA
jgi:hypothetical protein